MKIRRTEHVREIEEAVIKIERIACEGYRVSTLDSLEYLKKNRDKRISGFHPEGIKGMLSSIQSDRQIPRAIKARLRERLENSRRHAEIFDSIVAEAKKGE